MRALIPGGRRLQMLKMMFVLTVLSGHYNTAPVIISHHSSREACEKAFESLQTQLARNTGAVSYQTTVMRSHACTETEVWVTGREQ
jgi:hypothetical protein